MKKLALCSLLGLTVAACAMAQDKTDSIRLNKYKKVAKVQKGIASFYHDKFEGRATATGEIFSQAKMTAASNTYPLRCWVRVTNPRNKKFVIVWINDRMHRDNPRLIDLSHAAASVLGYIGKGITRVKVEYLGKKKPPEPAEVEELK